MQSHSSTHATSSGLLIHAPSQRRWHVTHGAKFVCCITAPTAAAAVATTRERWGDVPGFEAREEFPICDACRCRGPRADRHLCGRAGRTIALIGCSATKRDRPAPARELYQGTLFKLARAWSEAQGLDWYVLSAKHKLVHPDQVLEPYNERVPTNHELLYLWCLSVNDAAWRVAPRGRLILLCGADYTQAFYGGFGESHSETRAALYDRERPAFLGSPWPFIIELPLGSMPLGRKMQWLKRQLATFRQPELFAPGA